MISHPHPAPGLQNGCRRNWRSGGSGGYGHYRGAWGRGINTHSVAFIVCEVQVSGAGDGGATARRDLGLNQVEVQRGGEKKNQ